MFEITKYKEMVEEYCFYNYKWITDISELFHNPRKNFMRFGNTNNDILEVISFEVIKPHFKIIKLTIYKINNDFDNIINKSIDNIYKYTNDNINKDKINKFTIKIIENDKTFSITDCKYNIFKMQDVVKSNNEYQDGRMVIADLVKYILEKV